ncbi:hypothetical protein [Reyranella sp.]|uniref:hypothetical protein n=1 Tax=Reyranella sp. TaxID=1929291 RepID=UPI003D11B273
MAASMFRTEQLTLSINAMPARAGQLRRLGFEDHGATGFSSDHDVNGIAWELFSRSRPGQSAPVMIGTVHFVDTGYRAIGLPHDGSTVPSDNGEK